MSILIRNILLILLFSKIFLTRISEFYPDGLGRRRVIQHRHVVEVRKMVEKYNSSYLHFPANDEKTNEMEPIITIKKFAVEDLNSIMFGNDVILKNPIGHFSIYGLPKKKASQGMTVSEGCSHYNCTFCANGGFFNRATFQHYGNLISDDENVQVKETFNVNFGLTKSDQFIIGYFPPEKIKEMNFNQLITGIGWTTKNGKNFIEESKKIEVISESTPQAVSARLVVGFDNKGYLHIIQVNGKTDKSGYTLEGFSQFLEDYGIYNSVNLDGGGSTALVYNGNIVNQLGDQCIEKKYGYNYERCERPLSTILCFHSKRGGKKKEEKKKKKSGQFFNWKYVILVIMMIILMNMLIFSCVIIIMLLLLIRRIRKKELESVKFHYLPSSEEDDIERELITEESSKTEDESKKQEDVQDVDKKEEKEKKSKKKKKRKTRENSNGNDENIKVIYFDQIKT